jgi:NAD(P)-dependent dehydrogenase (short-subunit alcohol dehydrogenase family)
VNISSIFGTVATRSASPYVISKHAVIGITKTDALEYAGKGIRVNAVCPGYTKTNLLDEKVWDAVSGLAYFLISR